MRSKLGWPVVALACAVFGLGSPVLAKGGVAITLPDKRVAVLSQGDLESASIGSYSVAVFKDRNLMDFAAGAMFSRDGSIFQDDGKPRVKFADITEDGRPELIVYKLTAGSGNYLEVDALRIDKNELRLLARVQTDSKHDAIAALKAAYKRAARGKR
ncbi:PliI family lysozyme inhibitor of I-type lysozyme [Govanella unica]|uniref:PliI family lysozyme inhibitor of I-type lysozyme n=1 Tax=Govanella unica TaxID=2975056 RepID=A0A9X3TXF1_9PROT|nr:PliI family lysozyme inhibitor of I-type lysozyme [Govania unica]MDA5193469.1 PliI family lysozyme inhibitor of I-type lysozyme [Govania unica]